MMNRYFLAEYGLERLVSKKCDVYSFGSMMMEVFTRTKPNSEMFGENSSLRAGLPMLYLMD